MKQAATVGDLRAAIERLENHRLAPRTIGWCAIVRVSAICAHAGRHCRRYIWRRYVLFAGGIRLADHRRRLTEYGVRSAMTLTFVRQPMPRRTKRHMSPAPPS